MEYVALGMKRDCALDITGLTRHQYYYKPKNGRRGRLPSTQTIKNEQLVANEQVVLDMKSIQANKDLRCGKQRMTDQLQWQGYYINEKKVYRLMKENDLLFEKAKRGERNYVKYRIVGPECPLSHLEMDIKMIWIEERKTHAYILTVLDVFTRKVLEWHTSMSITQHTVKTVFERVIINHLQPSDMLSKGIRVEIRNDNDKRFSAKMVQAFFEKNYLNQVFTHPYTPQENGHIESFHKTLTVALKTEHFFTLAELEDRLILFYNNYNNHRTHTAICGLPPTIFHQAWDDNMVIRRQYGNRRVRFKLKVHPSQLSGNMNLREASCSTSIALNGQGMLHENKEANGATALQPSVHQSPSVASCSGKTMKQKTYI